MRASKIVAAALAIGMGGTAFWGLNHGLEAAQSAANPCRDVRLSMPDQNKCDSDMKSASTDTAKKQIAAAYQSKAVMSDKASPTAASAPSDQTPSTNVPGQSTAPSPAPSSPQ